jgi:hypothetical protein
MQNNVKIGAEKKTKKRCYSFEFEYFIFLNLIPDPFSCALVSHASCLLLCLFVCLFAGGDDIRDFPNCLVSQTEVGSAKVQQLIDNLKERAPEKSSRKRFETIYDSHN